MSKKINRVGVKSSSIKSIGYDKESRTLEVEFSSGQLYRYHDFPAKAHSALIDADSVGKYFTQHIKPKFTAHKVERKE